MKEQKTKGKKRVIYYLLLAVCVLVLAAATVLTVYFVTDKNDIVVDKPGTEDPVEPGIPDDPKEPDKPTGGDGPEYVKPVNAEYTLEYNGIYSNGSVGWYYRHTALDFAAKAGENVSAMTDGKIKEISLSKETGNYIVVEHDGGLVSCYRFVEPKEGLKVGDSVKTGDVIATVAEAYGSEAAAGEHLHFEVLKDGKFVDPNDYFDAVLAEK